MTAPNVILVISEDMLIFWADAGAYMEMVAFIKNICPRVALSRRGRQNFFIPLVAKVHRH
ncbi:MAG: hypothetical protein UY68_C0004G0052 [Parcubacteria group bacterium GW2011_GWF2_52_12]|nr:MAG: hypothetical protein UY68_C0004G0052 [Parcubacteria group bacterium GW2011_GWF2_52_12]